MNKTEYMTNRANLMAEAQAFIDAGKLEDAATKQKEIEVLDSTFENTAKAQANLNALNNKQVVPPALRDVAHTDPANVIDAANDDIYDSIEYKNAFMNYVLHGKAIPAKFSNVDAGTVTSEVGSVIPTTTIQKIVEKMESIGNILPLVTHTSYKGGVAVPTSSAKPTASWVSEGSGSYTQEKTTGSITFSYYKLRCAVRVSLETSVVTYPMFESRLVENVADAMVKAKEQAIISGDGTGKPKGILAETVVSGQNVDITEGNGITYANLCDVEAALPLAYDADAVWFMTKKTFMKIQSLVDSDGQPVARTNYGLAGKPERMVLGRKVVLNDYMSSWAASVTADTIIAFLFNPKDYLFNTNYNLTMSRYTDQATDDEVTKAIELCDGKVIDKNSLVTLTVKNS